MSGPALLLLALLATCGCAAAPVSVAPVGPPVLGNRPESGGAAFLGSEVCRACHQTAYDRWRATAHASEYTGLSPADRQRSACLRCHVTGYGERFGYRATGAGPDLANVGCEACHGPGADHGRSAHPELVPTLTGGACPPCEVNKLCRLCHTPERSPAFDLERALTQISCKS